MIHGPFRDLIITANIKVKNLGRRFDPASQDSEKNLYDFKQRERDARQRAD